MNTTDYIKHTENWIRSVVIDLNFCPFAAKVVLQKTVAYEVVNPANTKNVLHAVFSMFEKMNHDQSIETAFIITPNDFKQFDAYLKLINQAERRIVQNNYEGIYQVASFHPDYCFAGSNEADPANYTNRSPYPMLHLLRESSITKALSTYKNADAIPERNINLAHEKGLKYMQVLRSACFNN